MIAGMKIDLWRHCLRPHVLSDQDRLTHHQNVHFGAEKAIKRLLWLAYYGLVLIERGIKDHRNARETVEGLDQPIISGIGMSGDSL